MLRFLIIERPTTATLRPQASEASITPCRRWMCEEKLVTITRPGASRMMRLSAAATSCSDCVMPGRSAFVESASMRSTPSLAEPRELGEIGRAGRRSACGRSCSRRCAGSCPRWVWSATATASGIECVTRANSAANGPQATGSPSLSISMNSASRSRPCSSSFDLTMPSVSRVPQTSRTPISRITYGSAPMWSSWPCVRMTASMPPGALAQVGEVGQHEVDAEHLVAREREAAVDQDAALALLDDAQVVADLARGPPSGMMRTTSLTRRPSGLSPQGAERSTARCSSVASTSGSRGAPTRSPSELERRLERDGIGRHRRAPRRRPPARDRARARRRSRRPRRGRTCAACPADEVRGDADAADAAQLEERREQVVVAGVEHEPGVEDRARLVEVGRRLLDRDHVRALAREAREQRPARGSGSRAAGCCR